MFVYLFPECSDMSTVLVRNVMVSWVAVDVSAVKISVGSGAGAVICLECRRCSPVSDVTNIDSPQNLVHMDRLTLVRTTYPGLLRDAVK
jgi:hypothetical protein